MVPLLILIQGTSCYVYLFCGSNNYHMPFSAHPQETLWIGAWNPEETGHPANFIFDDGTSAENMFGLFNLRVANPYYRCGFLKSAPQQNPWFAFEQSCYTNMSHICEYSCPCQDQEPLAVANCNNRIGTVSKDGILDVL